MWHSLGGLRGELQRRLEAAPQVRMVRIVYAQGNEQRQWAKGITDWSKGEGILPPQDEASSLEPLKSPGLGFRWTLDRFALHAHSKTDICRNNILDYPVVCTKVLPNGSKWVRIASLPQLRIRVRCFITSLPNRPIGFELFWVDDDDDCKNTWDNEAREMCNKISLAGQFDDAV